MKLSDYLIERGRYEEELANKLKSESEVDTDENNSEIHDEQ